MEKWMFHCYSLILSQSIRRVYVGTFIPFIRCLLWILVSRLRSMKREWIKLLLTDDQVTKISTLFVTILGKLLFQKIFRDAQNSWQIFCQYCNKRPDFMGGEYAFAWEDGKRKRGFSFCLLDMYVCICLKFIIIIACFAWSYNHFQMRKKERKEGRP